MSSRPTRRQLLAGGIGAAAGLAGISAVSAQGDTSGQGMAPPNWAQDGQVLQQLLGTEHMQEYGAEKSLGSGKLGHDARELVLLIRANAGQHVTSLQEHLRALHVPAKPSPSTIPVDVVGLFNNIKNEVSALQGMVQVESLVESAYWNAAGAFHDPRLAQLAAEILASQAQQWALLEALLHRGDPTKAAPFPYVRGASAISKPHTTTSS